MTEIQTNKVTILDPNITLSSSVHFLVTDVNELESCIITDNSNGKHRVTGEINGEPGKRTLTLINVTNLSLRISNCFSEVTIINQQTIQKKLNFILQPGYVLCITRDLAEVDGNAKPQNAGRVPILRRIVRFFADNFPARWKKVAVYQQLNPQKYSVSLGFKAKTEIAFSASQPHNGQNNYDLLEALEVTGDCPEAEFTMVVNSAVSIEKFIGTSTRINNVKNNNSGLRLDKITIDNCKLGSEIDCEFSAFTFKSVSSDSGKVATFLNFASKVTDVDCERAVMDTSNNKFIFSLRKVKFAKAQNAATILQLDRNYLTEFIKIAIYTIEVKFDYLQCTLKFDRCKFSELILDKLTSYSGSIKLKGIEATNSSFGKIIVKTKTVVTYLSFQSCRFLAVPDLDNLSIEKNIDFVDSEFLGQTRDDQDNFQKLKRIAKELGKESEELRFFNLERALRLANSKRNRIEKSFDCIMKVTSGYGQSIVRPVVCLGILLIASHCFYHIFDFYNLFELSKPVSSVTYLSGVKFENLTRYWQLFIFNTTNMVGPFRYLIKTEVNFSSVNFVVILFQMLQLLLSSFFWLILILNTRRKFKLNP